MAARPDERWPQGSLATALTLGDALATAYGVLRAAGVDSPRLIALVTLAATLGVDKAALLAHPARSLLGAERVRYAEALDRLARHEPLAYVLGQREFYGREFTVTPAVLVPRPETELLVELALEHLRASPAATGWLVDVGTGSGALAVTLAAERPGLPVLATDRSLAALAVARQNAQQHGVADRVALLGADLLAGVRGPLRAVVANLPYIPEALIAGLMPTVAAFEPRLALDGGPDGLVLIRRLLAQLAARLAPGGLAALEFGAEQAEAVQMAARQHFPTADLAIVRDLAGLPRALRLQTA